jgi:hypothetical protein
MPLHHTNIQAELESTIILIGAGFAAIPQQFYFATDTNRYFYSNSDGSITALAKDAFPVNTQDDFPTVTPKNYLYTNASGQIKSAPLFKVPFITLSAAASIAADNVVILLNRTTSNFTVTLGTTSDYINKLFFFKRIDINTGGVVLDPAGSVQIDGAATATLSSGDGAILFFDGTAYRRLARN